MASIGIVEIMAILGFLGTFLATVALGVWRLAVLATRLDKVELAGKSAHTRLDKYVEKQEQALEELRQQINKVISVQSSIESKLTLLIDGKVKLT